MDILTNVFYRVFGCGRGVRHASGIALALTPRKRYNGRTEVPMADTWLSETVFDGGGAASNRAYRIAAGRADVDKYQFNKGLAFGRQGNWEKNGDDSSMAESQQVLKRAAMPDVCGKEKRASVKESQEGVMSPSGGKTSELGARGFHPRSYHEQRAAVCGNHWTQKWVNGSLDWGFEGCDCKRCLSGECLECPVKHLAVSNRKAIERKPKKEVKFKMKETKPKTWLEKEVM